ncbi:hypothetical protein YC2023_043481 [Brassica napus]
MLKTCYFIKRSPTEKGIERVSAHLYSVKIHRSHLCIYTDYVTAISCLTLDIQSNANGFLESQKTRRWCIGIKLLYVVNVEKEEWKLETRRKMDWLTDKMRGCDHTVSATHVDMD